VISRKANILVIALGMAPFTGALGSDEPVPHKSAIDASTIDHKVLCGYQGWFRCPGDPANEGWRHWSRDPKRIAADTLTF
jgi:hypothetical protein